MGLSVSMSQASGADDWNRAWGIGPRERPTRPGPRGLKSGTLWAKIDSFRKWSPELFPKLRFPRGGKLGVEFKLERVDFKFGSNLIGILLAPVNGGGITGVLERGKDNGRADERELLATKVHLSASSWDQF